MIVEFPKPLYTIAQRREDQLCFLIESIDEIVCGLGVEMDEEHFEYLFVTLSDILEDLNV